MWCLKCFIMDDRLKSCGGTILILLVVAIFYIIIYYTTDGNGNGSTGSGSYYGGSRPGGGRGSSGGGRGSSGCFSADTMVWTKNESSPDTFATEVMVGDVIEGHLVGTLDTSVQNSGHYKFMWTRATDVTIYHGIFKAHNFSFSSGHHITVTSPHLMMVLKDGQFYFLRADNVELGDKMMVNGIASKVTNIETFKMNMKIAIETEDATIETNGVLASGLCEDNPDVADRTVVSNALVTDYKNSHFGENSNEICMAFKTWKKAYNLNNEFFF